MGAGNKKKNKFPNPKQQSCSVRVFILLFSLVLFMAHWCFLASNCTLMSATLDFIGESCMLHKWNYVCWRNWAVAWWYLRYLPVSSILNRPFSSEASATCQIGVVSGTPMQHTSSCLESFVLQKKAAAFHCHVCLTTKLACKLSNKINASHP
jgi:hypothetical protein